MNTTVRRSASSSSLITGKTDTRMTSLIIRALETAPHKRRTVGEIYEKLIELNPSLKERQSDWQGTVRHTLSTSTMFVLLPKTKPGQWTIDYNGDRSTHKNRRRKRSVEQTVQVPRREKKRVIKRLGTTLRRIEPSSNWASISTSKVVEGDRWSLSISAMPTTSSSEQRAFDSLDSRTFPFSYPFPPRNVTVDTFMDEVNTPSVPRNSGTTSQLKKLPSQFVDTTREPFPPAPRIDSLQRIHSQTSSSISFSQSLSQSLSQTLSMSQV